MAGLVLKASLRGRLISFLGEKTIIAFIYGNDVITLSICTLFVHSKKET